MGQLSVSEARATLPKVLDRVIAGEEITITRHGVPVAMLLRPDAVRVRRAQPALHRAREIGARLDAARERAPGQAALSAARADDLVATVRAERGGS